MKRSALTYLLAVLILAGCSRTPKDEGTLPAPLFPQPQSIKANPEGGYTVNPVTGDTIQPIINSLGDTVLTGVPIPVKGKIIHPDSVAKPKVVKAPAIESIEKHNAHPNRHKIPDNIPTIQVDHSQLKTIKVGEGNQDFVLVSSTGDTIPTGVPIPAKGKVVKTIQPQPIKALPPAFKDAAIANLQYLDVDQGMNSSTVYSILEDIRGNLWFGTWGGGVSMYNGETYQHFTVKEGLSSNYVLSILQDNNGNLWFGTFGGGLSMYNGESFRHFTQKEGLSHNQVFSILEDTKGNIWFGTYGGGVSYYDGQSFTHYTEKEGLSNNNVFSIIEDINGYLWFGTFGGGVSMYDGDTFRHFTEKEGLCGNYVQAILEDKSGNLWFGATSGGISMYIPSNDGQVGTFTHFTEKEGLSGSDIQSILEDQSGNLWFGTFGGGVSNYDGATFTHYTEKEGLSDDKVMSITEDQSGNLWMGTYDGGVSMYNGESFRHFTEEEGSSNSSVLSILEDKNGNLWFGTYDEGVRMLTKSGIEGRFEETYQHFTEKEGLSNNHVRSILEDRNGSLWFATVGGGVSVYKSPKDGQSGTFTHFTEKEGLSSNDILSILEDTDGNLWFGTDGGGVSMYDGKSFLHFTEKEGLSTNYVVSILEDKNGNLWFGVGRGGGVCMYDGHSFRHFTIKEGLRNNQVFSILEDEKGHLWFGTIGGGISIYNGHTSSGNDCSHGICKHDLKVQEDLEIHRQYLRQTFTHFTEKEGLSHNTVWSISKDYSGKLWIGTEKGLTLISEEDIPGRQTNGLKPEMGSKNNQFNANVFYKYDGLKGLAFYLNSAFIDSKNRAWWGTDKSLTMLDLNKFQLSQNPPSVYLKHVEIDEQFIDYRNLPDSLAEDIKFIGVEKFENYPLDLKLPYDKNHLTLHFAGIDWSAPHKIQYSYRMMGLNNKWSIPSKEAKAEYRNLPVGTFTFQLSAIGESGEWSEPFEYTFTITPPWYETTWYYIIQTAFLLVLVLIAVMLNRTRKGDEWVIVLTFVVMITIFEFFLILVAPLVENFSSGIPIIKLVVNVGLALSLNPIEKFVRAYM